MKADETIWENLDLSHDACAVFLFCWFFFWLNFTIMSCWMPQIHDYAVLWRISAIVVTDWSINDAFKMQGNVSQQGEKCSPLKFPSFHFRFCFSYCADPPSHSQRSSSRGHWWWCCLIPGRRGKDKKVEDKQINSGQGSVVQHNLGCLAPGGPECVSIELIRSEFRFSVGALLMPCQTF